MTFRARGNEPSWAARDLGRSSIELDDSSSAQRRIGVPVPRADGERARGATYRTFVGHARARSSSIDRVPCNDTMSGEAFDGDGHRHVREHDVVRLRPGPP